MKIIKIEFCNDCPSFNSESPDMYYEGGCFCEKSIKKLQDWYDYCQGYLIEIPEWCELEDYERDY